ncbi:hypothetical protein NDU88_004399 [Pleurodeles waltl]|uniref:Uncharacterized protein n=1 Tax=Pleurodeles waltl TaxID=8319 RepID=A0AAV7SIU1_PLEWA|nr:hypothetical protein NDU88_004399 [Pleurodeles waltl]
MLHSSEYSDRKQHFQNGRGYKQLLRPTTPTAGIPPMIPVTYRNAKKPKGVLGDIIKKACGEEYGKQDACSLQLKLQRLQNYPIEVMLLLCLTFGFPPVLHLHHFRCP